MRTQLVLFGLFFCISLVAPGIATADDKILKIDTMAGKWKLISTTLEGKPYVNDFYGFHTVGKTWVLRNDGKTYCGGTETKWTYDPELGRFDASIKNVFGYWVDQIVDGEVKPVGDNVTISWKSGGFQFVYTLEPLDKIKISKITLDKALKHVEVKESPPIQAAIGSPQIKKVEYTVKHSVSIQKGVRAGFEVKGTLSVLQTGIKHEIEESTNNTYEESKTSSHEVTIPGNGKRYKLVWIETYRTGKATVVVEGKEQIVPFEFRDGWDLSTEEIDD